MKFLIDAQLPVRLAQFFEHAGHDAIHTSKLPAGNHSTDARITEIADDEYRVVVTKDRDFRDGHLLWGSPRRLLVVGTATSPTLNYERFSATTAEFILEEQLTAHGSKGAFPMPNGHR